MAAVARIGRHFAVFGTAIRPLVTWWQARHPLVRDAVLPIALAALAFAPGLANEGVVLGELPARPLDLAGVLLGLAQCVPLLLRRTSTVVCLALVSAAFCADQLLAYPSGFGSLGLLVALYAAGERVVRYRVPVIAAGVAVYAGLAVGLHVLGSPERPVDFGTFLLVLCAFWVLGGWARSRRLAERRRRALDVQLAVADERARIARELHDVVTHHLTAMVVQSDAAQFLLPGSPDRAANGLTAISATGRRALGELRQLLDVLDRPRGSGTAPYTAPGRIGGLVEPTRD